MILKKIAKNMLCICLLAIYCGTSLGQSLLPCLPGEYIITYLNGVRTPPQDSMLAVLRLQKEFGTTYNGQPLRIARFYNPYESDAADLAEVYKQAVKENPDLQDKWEYLQIMLYGANYYFRIFTASTIGEAGGFIGKFQDELDVEMLKADPEAVSQIFIDKMNSYIDGRKKVLLVSHSQGNFFADTIYTAIKQRISPPNPATVKFIHVASPTKNIHGDYITNKNDLLIEKLRNIIPDLPSYNVTVGRAILSATFSETPDFLGHGFLSTYMNVGYPAYGMVKDKMQSALDSIEDYPCSAIIITSATCTLKKSTNPDGSVIIAPNPQRQPYDHKLTVVAEATGDVAAKVGGGYGSPDGRVWDGDLKIIDCGSWIRDSNSSLCVRPNQSAPERVRWVSQSTKSEEALDFRLLQAYRILPGVKFKVTVGIRPANMESQSTQKIVQCVEE